MNMKLLLIQSTPYDLERRPVKKKRLYFVGLAFPILAALTPADWEVEVCLETIEDIPWDTDADLVGISSMGHAVIRSIDIAAEFRRRGKTVVMGGYMTSLMPGEAAKHCDSVIVGDGETVWAEMLSDFARGELKPRYERPVEALTWPLPRYELLLGKKIGSFLPVQAGRGCPHSCSFCSVYCLYHNRDLQRPLEEVVRDIRRVRELGFRRFLLLDDNICANPGYMSALCDEIKKLGMTWFSQCSINIARQPELLRKAAESGCIALSFGLESISRESLEAMDKGWEDPGEYRRLLGIIADAGIDISTEMVVGADGDTLESIAATAAFIEESGAVVPRFYILTPIPGTLFHKQMEEQGRIWNHDMYSYNAAEAVHIPRHMTPEELTKAYWDLYEAVFAYKSIFKRTVLHRRFWRRPFMYLFYLGVNLFYRGQIKRRITPNII